MHAGVRIVVTLTKYKHVLGSVGAEARVRVHIFVTAVDHGHFS